MGIKTLRIKQKKVWISIFYRIQKIIPITNTMKFRLFLNLEWIFDRFAHELSFKIYTPEQHPIRQVSKSFLLKNISNENTVLDLGCNLGDISFIIAEKAKEVIGIDYNSFAIEKAKNIYVKDNLEFINKEALDYLKTNNKKFDILILSHILEHIEEPKDFLLTYKGFFTKIYIEVPDFERYYLNKYRKDLKMDLIYSDNDHVSEFDRNEIQEMLKECNIEIIEEEFKYGVMKFWCKVT